ncbi:MAG: shikimate kinase [Lacipirellulaceae bacterium]
MEPTDLETGSRAIRRLFLTGYRGTGKTTIARILAKKLSLSTGEAWSAIDADDEIELVAGKSIASMFAEEGEPVFRDLEERVVADLCGGERVVVALGGGAVLREATRKRLAEAGPVVWLTAPAEELARRLAADAATALRRPSLTGLPPAEEVARVLAERTPVYAACATFAVATEGRSPELIADEVVARLRGAFDRP